MRRDGTGYKSAGEERDHTSGTSGKGRTDPGKQRGPRIPNVRPTTKVWHGWRRGHCRYRTPTDRSRRTTGTTPDSRQGGDSGTICRTRLTTRPVLGKDIRDQTGAVGDRVGDLLWFGTVERNEDDSRVPLCVPEEECFRKRVWKGFGRMRGSSGEENLLSYNTKYLSGKTLTPILCMMSEWRGLRRQQRNVQCKIPNIFPKGTNEPESLKHHRNNKNKQNRTQVK